MVVPEDVAEMEAAVRVREVELRAREARLLPLGAVAAAHGVSMTLAEQRQSVCTLIIHAMPFGLPCFARLHLKLPCQC